MPHSPLGEEWANQTDAVLAFLLVISSSTRSQSASSNIKSWGLVRRQGSRRLEAIGRIDANAVTPEDASARVAGGLLGITRRGTQRGRQLGVNETIRLVDVRIALPGACSMG
jgi:hypothetical protein